MFDDAPSFEKFCQILFDYAGVQLSVASSIEPLFDKLGHTVLASGQIKHFDVKILSKDSVDPAPSTSFIIPSFVSFRSLSVQSVIRQTFEHDRLHSANVQVGIRIQRIQQEFNLSLLRLLLQFYNILAVSMNSNDEFTVRRRPSTIQDETEFVPTRTNTITNQSDLVNYESNFSPVLSESQNVRLPTSTYFEAESWTKLRQLIQDRALLEKSNMSKVEINDNRMTDSLLLSSLVCLIIDEIDYAATLGGLKVDGCMGKVQGSMNLSQRLRALDSLKNKHSSKKYVFIMISE